MGSFPTTFEMLKATSDITSLETDILLVPVFQETGPTPKRSTKKSTSSAKTAEEDTTQYRWTPQLAQLDNAMHGHLKASIEAEKWTGSHGKRRVFRVRQEDTLKACWVVLIGMGLPGKLNVRKATSAFLSGLKDTYGYEKVHRSVIALPEGTQKINSEQWLQAAVFAAHQSTYKTQEAGEKKIHALKHVQFIPQTGQSFSHEQVVAAQAMAQAESLAKDLANKPANLKTAETLAEAARAMAKLPGLSVEVISDTKRIQKDMPAFWAVAQGSAHSDPPRFIQVNYKPAGKIHKKIALVGKGVIFDTGGVQVKTGNNMNDMKFDMTGAASVLAVIKAAAELKLKGIQVSAYVAATRNAIGPEAYLPDSIIDSASGKKIEIRHTDAEGRVTLADAVHKATLDKPDEMVTVATLTGSASLAVGHCIALMGTDDDLLDRLAQTGKAVGETVQKLEILEEDFESIKSDRDAADLSNTSKNRNRGHLSAGAFVISFAGDIPTAHMDIAGGDAKDGNATGIAVKGLIEYLRKEAASRKIVASEVTG